MKTKEEILKDQVGSYTFDELIDNEPGIITAMEEYAKQQTIAFVKWAIESEKIMGDSYCNAFIPGPEEELYDQFIESQNK
jgi:hypothetical protein